MTPDGNASHIQPGLQAPSAHAFGMVALGLSLLFVPLALRFGLLGDAALPTEVMASVIEAGSPDGVRWGVFLLLAESFTSFLLFAASLHCLWLFIMRRQRLPARARLLFIVLFFYAVLDLALLWLIAPGGAFAALSHWRTLAGILVSALLCGVWLPYLSRSSQVRAVFNR